MLVAKLHGWATRRSWGGDGSELWQRRYSPGPYPHSNSKCACSCNYLSKDSMPSRYRSGSTRSALSTARDLVEIAALNAPADSKWVDSGI
jgi:hypothetical protein